MTSIVILISGRGSNMEAIVRAAQKEAWPAKISAVISNRPDAGGLDFARSHNIPAESLDHRQFESRQAFDAALIKLIDTYQPDLVVLAGFMRILTADFVQHYEGRLLNIHPSLLPLFPGLATHEQALEAGVQEHGATVHFVTEALDHGPIVLQASVPVVSGDTPDTLAQRVLKQEHIIYPRAVRWFIDNRISIDQNRVLVSPPESQLLVSQDK
ncbi:phosphoribosylglycinamide formyltransferase [Polynucleobacter sp. 30F-ANTBAC]|jgi:phosphoribosylglycinamide formyltransferase 1|uniref:phosphoribosylglycinamide formyltransferase n=1 Tax=Polynucleobacter sp. 30F-ANTBAC TaxID=2689095 RepID=UPI001C0C0B8A|nr:phosphoribosylglycinamide formyltransferase [Polynucleobacter sp. 30F-ANTBAC]MBU3600345.1 phosphoribosylglycinamide formyltransferase [Polynucleobacter sp. 30F-ANTBAC]